MPPASLPILDEESSTCSESSDTHFKPCQNKGIPHLITQEDLNDLVRNLNLSKGKSELLGSRLQQSNLLSPGTKVSFYRQKSKRSSNFFSTDGEICNCIDGSKKSYKAVFLHNGNILSSVPVHIQQL